MPGALSAFKGQWPFQAQHHLAGAMPVFSAKMTRHHHRMCILLYICLHLGALCSMATSGWTPGIHPHNLVTPAVWQLLTKDTGAVPTAETSSMASGVHGAELTDTSPGEPGTHSPKVQTTCTPHCGGNQQVLGSAGKGFGPGFARVQHAARTWIPHLFACLVIYAAAFAGIIAYFFFDDF